MNFEEKLKIYINTAGTDCLQIYCLGLHKFFNQAMQKKLFIILLILCSLQIAAQENTSQHKGVSITGSVTDSITGKPIEYATITLFKNGSSKPVNGTVTNSTGRYTIVVADSGMYKIVAEFIGYHATTPGNIFITKKTGTVVLPAMALLKNSVTMQGVTVSSAKGLVENKIDKLVFNAEKDVTSQGGVATDILKKVPQVSVDVDGKVELAGSSSIRFLINGKPSTAFGSNVADVLQSIPASQIKSIEVITNPGAKYDAQGMGGIINIILKQNKIKGINGNISVTAGTLNENGSVNFNARKTNFGINAFVSGNARLTTAVYNNSERLSVDTAGKKNLSLQQNSSSHFKRHGVETGAGFDWTYKKHNNFSGSFRYGKFANEGWGYSKG